MVFKNNLKYNGVNAIFVQNYCMQKLNLPEYDFRIKNEGQSKQIFDKLRGRFVALTPEEWVRQHFILFLIEEKKYPSGLFSIERSIKLNELNKRSDLVVFDRNGQPWMLVEFKSFDVSITQETFYQAARYNMVHKVPYMVVSNGMEHYCCRMTEDNFEFMDDLPEFES